jgi:hypothetical protein
MAAPAAARASRIFAHFFLRGIETMTAYSWKYISGDWKTAGNWTPAGGPPKASDDVTINIAILTLSGTNTALTLTAHSLFDDATVNGAGIVFTAGPAGVGSTAVAGLTVGGSVAWTNARAITQNGGALTLGDSSNGAAKLTNAKAGVYDITDDHGVAAGNASASIANAGIFEKTSGM